MYLTLSARAGDMRSAILKTPERSLPPFNAPRDQSPWSMTTLTMAGLSFGGDAARRPFMREPIGGQGRKDCNVLALASPEAVAGNVAQGNAASRHSMKQSAYGDGHAGESDGAEDSCDRCWRPARC